MAQETWGLKLDAELKEKVQEIVKSDFESSKEFMEQLVNMYELHQLKQGENVLTAEIEELESLTRRINGIFINANAKINTMLQDKDIKATEQIELKQKLVERLQGNLSKIEQEKEDISNINDTLVNLNNNYLEDVNQLNQSNHTLNDLVSEYKEKNDILTGLLAEYKADREQNKQLEQDKKDLSNQLYQLNEKVNEQEKEIVASSKKEQEQIQKHQNDIEEILKKQANEIETLRKMAQIDINMRMLELQQENQRKMQEIQDRHNNEIEQYQARYKNLLESLEQKKVNSKSESKTRTKNKIKE
ncbi:MAG: hypothetical protein RSE41_08015 [Clostridia bacterium]